MDELIVKKSIAIKTDPDRVWQVLTNPNITKKYMYGSRVRSRWLTGSPVEWIGEEEGKEIIYVKGKIIEIIPEKILRLIVYHPCPGVEYIPEDYLDLIYELSFSNGETMLTIMEGDFNKVKKGEKRYHDTIAGWNNVLPKIKEIAESR